MANLKTALIQYITRWADGADVGEGIPILELIDNLTVEQLLSITLLIKKNERTMWNDARAI